jgi:hypothetical protein
LACLFIFFFLLVISLSFIMMLASSIVANSFVVKASFVTNIAL